MNTPLIEALSCMKHLPLLLLQLIIAKPDILNKIRLFCYDFTKYCCRTQGKYSVTAISYIITFVAKCKTTKSVMCININYVPLKFFYTFIIWANLWHIFTVVIVRWMCGVLFFNWDIQKQQ